MARKQSHARTRRRAAGEQNTRACKSSAAATPWCRRGASLTVWTVFNHFYTPQVQKCLCVEARAALSVPGFGESDLRPSQLPATHTAAWRSRLYLRSPCVNSQLCCLLQPSPRLGSLLGRFDLFPAAVLPLCCETGSLTRALISGFAYFFCC